jgi:siderophore synthetase component
VDTYFDGFEGKVESASNKRVRKQAIKWLINEVWRENLDFKSIKCKDSKDCKKNPHTAFTVDEFKKMLKLTLEAKNLELHCALLALYTFAARV